MSDLIERLKVKERATLKDLGEHPRHTVNFYLEELREIIAALSAPQPAPVAASYPGVMWMDVDPSSLPCGRCGGEVREFAIPNEVWNLVMRPHGKEGELPEYICLGCWHERLLAALQSRQVEVPAAFTKRFKCDKCEHSFQLTVASTPCPSCDQEACAVTSPLPAQQGDVADDATDSREWLVGWMRENFPTDRTFADYIRTKLADDFAHQLAKALQSRPAAPAQAMPEGMEYALNTKHKRCHEAADAFWQYWNANGETHKHGYYESTWGAINEALRMVGVCQHEYRRPPKYKSSVRTVGPERVPPSGLDVHEFRAAIVGWREHDHPEWFCRRTAEYVADLGRRAEQGATQAGSEA